jgi:muramoyltetrapeptide carboxypeptidase LdcA involved in peptidoglycan recycling
MAQLEPIDLSQTENNSLTAIAEQERKKLFPRNDYNIKNEYSAVNPDALATGDVQGKGTGGDLDVYNTSAGSN